MREADECCAGWAERAAGQETEKEVRTNVSLAEPLKDGQATDAFWRASQRKDNQKASACTP